MALENTTILKAGEQDAAKDKLQLILQKADVLKVFIFGNDQSASDAAEKADVRAGAVVSGIGRIVVWMQDTGQVPLFKMLIKDGPDIPADTIDVNKHIGISLSLNNLLMDLILKNPEPDYIRMELAFINAGTN